MSDTVIVLSYIVIVTFIINVFSYSLTIKKSHEANIVILTLTCLAVGLVTGVAGTMLYYMGSPC